ncbi:MULTISPECIES: hypothetical protein [Sphingomonadaceae]|uniref:hypothetical protein n=1 Tax=Blastomonas fulva TaxID=1550728 RepID=UPI00403417D3
MKIPDSLSDGEHLRIAPLLASAYLASLQAHGLYPVASGLRPDPAPVGGLSKEATDEHYAHAFDGSAARVQLALLDPLREVQTAASTLRQFLSGGALCLTDVPGGAGAGALSLLCSIAELRAQQILPREPLNVKLLWGEISAPALDYASDLLLRVVDSLAEQAIFVDHECFNWDVLSEISNAELVERIIIEKSKSSQVLILISNFNGFLERGGKKDAAFPQLKELFKYGSGRLNAAVWIEPDMNAAKQKLFPFVMAKLAKLVGFAKPFAGGSGNETTHFKFFIPIKPHSIANVRLCVMPIDLDKGH